MSEFIPVQRHPVYDRAHGRIGEKNTRLSKVRNREGTTRALRKSFEYDKDGTTPMKTDEGRWRARGELAGGKRTGDLAQRGSESRRKRRFVLG